MVEKLFRKWKLEKNENFDDYMKANKVNFALRHVGNRITSYEEISRDGDNWKLHITSTFKNSLLEFKLGEPFEELTLDSKKMKSTFTIEGDLLKHVQDPIKEGDVPNVYTREVLEDGRMMVTCTSVPTNTVCKRYFVPCESS